MASTAGHSLGSHLLSVWQGGSSQIEAGELLGLDKATYSRFVNGVRKPSARLCFKIEKLTNGSVPADSWFEPAPKQRAA